MAKKSEIATSLDPKQGVMGGQYDPILITGVSNFFPQVNEPVTFTLQLPSPPTTGSYLITQAVNTPFFEQQDQHKLELRPTATLGTALRFKSTSTTQTATMSFPAPGAWVVTFVYHYGDTGINTKPASTTILVEEPDFKAKQVKKAPKTTKVAKAVKGRKTGRAR